MLSIDENRAAAFYICVVLFWYGLGFVLTLYRNTRHHEENENYSNAISILKEETHRIEILNTLKDPQRREQLWEMYHGKRVETVEHPISRETSIE